MGTAKRPNYQDQCVVWSEHSAAIKYAAGLCPGNRGGAAPGDADLATESWRGRAWGRSAQAAVELGVWRVGVPASPRQSQLWTWGPSGRPHPSPARQLRQTDSGSQDPRFQTGGCLGPLAPARCPQSFGLFRVNRAGLGNCTSGEVHALSGTSMQHLPYGWRFLRANSAYMHTCVHACDEGCVNQHLTEKICQLV